MKRVERAAGDNCFGERGVVGSGRGRLNEQLVTIVLESVGLLEAVGRSGERVLWSRLMSVGLLVLVVVSVGIEMGHVVVEWFF